MKKILCLTLTLCLVLAQCIIFAGAQTASALIDVQNVMPGGQGVGYYDNLLNGGAGTLETVDGSSICLRGSDEWAKYDLTQFDLASGTYSVSVEYCSILHNNLNSYLDILIDDTLKLKSELTITSPSWEPAIYTVAPIGNVYLDNSQTLTIKNTGTNAVYVKQIILDFVDEGNLYDNTVRYSGQNITAYKDFDVNLVTHRMGTDYYDVAGMAFTSNSISQTHNVVLHTNDWARYDVSDLRPGTYSVSAYAANTKLSNLTLTMDGTLKLIGSLPARTDYTDHAKVNIGNIYIPSGSQTMIIKASASTFLRYFELTYLSDERLVDPNIRLEAENVQSYYDNPLKEGPRALEEVNGATGRVVTLRQDEWLRYDVSGIEPGTYIFSINNSSNADVFLDVSLDDKIYFERVLVETRNGYGNYVTDVFGKIYIPANAQTLTVKNLLVSVAFIDYFNLEYVGVANTAASSKTIEAFDVVKQNGATAHGYSYFDAGGEQKWETNSNKYVVLRGGDWVRYDVSALEPGIYTVKALVGNNNSTALAVSTDGGTQSQPVTVEPTGNYLLMQEVMLGQVNIQDGTQSIEIIGGATNAMYFRSFKLEKSPMIINAVYASDHYGNNAIDSLSEAQFGAVYSAVSVVNDAHTQNLDFTVVVASYKDGMLKSCAVENESLPAGEVFSKNYHAASGDIDEVKTFIWEKDTMKPLIAAEIID